MPPSGRQAILKIVVRQRCRKGSIPSSSFLLPTGSQKARHRADNAGIGGAVPPRWISYDFIYK